MWLLFTWTRQLCVRNFCVWISFISVLEPRGPVQSTSWELDEVPILHRFSFPFFLICKWSVLFTRRLTTFFSLALASVLLSLSILYPRALLLQVPYIRSPQFLSRWLSPLLILPLPSSVSYLACWPMGLTPVSSNQAYVSRCWCWGSRLSGSVYIK